MPQHVKQQRASALHRASHAQASDSERDVYNELKPAGGWKGKTQLTLLLPCMRNCTILCLHHDQKCAPTCFALLDCCNISSRLRCSSACCASSLLCCCFTDSASAFRPAMTCLRLTSLNTFPSPSELSASIRRFSSFEAFVCPAMLADVDGMPAVVRR